MTEGFELLNYEDFVSQLTKIEKFSHTLLDNWQIQNKEDSENAIYATKRVRKMWKNEDNYEELVTFEYHISYSTSYCVPLISFIAYKNNGSQLSPAQCWEILNLKKSYSMLTQMDHPVLQRPFLTIHPCKTTDFIKQSFNQSTNIIVSWLSAVGPHVGLNVLPEYEKLTKKEHIYN